MSAPVVDSPPAGPGMMVSNVASAGAVAPALARALHRHAELGDEIPEALYTAVAEVLAYVFQLRAYSKHGGVRPEVPGELDVPPQLDPQNPASHATGKNAAAEPGRAS